MKNLILSLAAVTLLCSACSPLLYQQIATLSSENVNLKDNGAFAYEDGIMTIEYDFWSESGKFNFIVTNNSDDDIYLNLAESYFVNNGYAQDYYQARTYVYTSRSVTASGSKGSSAVAGASIGTSVEYAEKAIVCIPAHSCKDFEEFSVSTSVFRECGFVRDPSEKETAIREYDGYTSPRVIENRLVFKIGEVTIPITNIFYVSQYQNISTEDATEYVKAERCDGSKHNVKVHKLSANNKFYITYNVTYSFTKEGAANDRESQPKLSLLSAKFNDGIYESRK